MLRLLVLALLIPASVEAQTLTLTWTDNSGGLANTRVERGLSTFGPFAQAAQVAPGVTTWMDTGLPYSATYCYRVAAFNAEGTSDFSNIACGTTQAAPPPPPTQYTLTVSKTGPGSITGYPGGINCGSVCSASYPSGSSVILTAVPANGARFQGWSGACSGTLLTCTVTMTQAKSASAGFAKGGKK